MLTEAAICLKRSDFEKNVKQVPRRPMTLLVTYDRAGFTCKSLRNHVQKYYAFSPQGKLLCTLRTLYVYATESIHREKNIVINRHNRHNIF